MNPYRYGIFILIAVISLLVNSCRNSSASKARTFHDLGIRYITLCHSRNNDLCDSSTDPDGPEFNGLSEFGEAIIREMDRLGVMVDVSHISDSAFYDVRAIPSKPVIASHSCAQYDHRADEARVFKA